MTFENEKILENITVNLDEQKEIVANCVAVGGNMKPEFNWYVGDQLFGGTFESKEEHSTIIYTSVGKFNLSMEQNEEVLKCEIVHKGYNKQQLKAGINLIETQLNLNFKASFSEPEAEGNTVKISFKCNPEPTGGQWIIEDGLTIHFGTNNGTFQASEILKVDGKNQYEAILNHTLNEVKTANIEVVNDLGIALHYSFEIGAYNKLIVVILHLIPLILILVAMIAVIYLLYKKKFLCFKERKENVDDKFYGTESESSKRLMDHTIEMGETELDGTDRSKVATTFDEISEDASQLITHDSTSSSQSKHELLTKNEIKEEERNINDTNEKDNLQNVVNEVRGQSNKVNELSDLDVEKEREGTDFAESKHEDKKENEIKVDADTVNEPVGKATKSRDLKIDTTRDAFSKPRNTVPESPLTASLSQDKPDFRNAISSPEPKSTLEFKGFGKPTLTVNSNLTVTEETLDDIVDSISSMAIMPEKKEGLEADGNAKSETKDPAEPQAESSKIEGSSIIVDSNLTVSNADDQQNNTRSRKTKPVIDIKAATSWRPSTMEPDTPIPMLHDTKYNTPDTTLSPEIVPMLQNPLKAARMPNIDTKPEENLDDIVDSISSMVIMPEKKAGLEADSNAKSETEDPAEPQLESYKIEDSSPIEDPNLTVPNADGQQINSRSRKSSFNSDHSSGSSNVSQTLVYYSDVTLTPHDGRWH